MKIDNPNTVTQVYQFENQYSDWNLILGNPISLSHSTPIISIGNDGTFSYYDANVQTLALYDVGGNQIALFNGMLALNQSYFSTWSKSILGKYFVLVDVVSKKVKVYDQGVLLKTFDFSANPALFDPARIDTMSVAISPNGRYIAIIGEDMVAPSFTPLRLAIYEGV